MSNTNFKYGVSSYGVPILGGQQGLLTQGNSYFVDPTNGNDSFDGKSPGKAKATLPAGYALLTANQNDVLYYMAGSSSISLTAQLAWAKNYTHLVGIAAPSMVAQRARIFQNSATTGMDPLINITATGCSFRNFYAFQGVNDATSLTNIQVTGGRNYFENVHIAGIGNDTMDAANASSLKLNGAEECLFRHCSIGLDTIARGSAANSEILVDGAATRNTFEDCLIYAYIEHATNHPLVKLNDTTSADRWLMFVRCLFNHFSVNRSVTPTTVFSIPASHQTCSIILQDCLAVSGTSSATDWDSNDRGIIWNNTPAAAAGAAGGLSTNQ